MATAKHARPRRTLRQVFRQVMKGTMLLAVSVVVALAVSVPLGFAQGSASPVERAEIATATTTAKVTVTISQTDDACHALSSYDVHPDAARLERLIAEASYLGKSYLKADIFEYVADLTSPAKNAPEYASVADQYANEDCFGGA